MSTRRFRPTDLAIALVTTMALAIPAAPAAFAAPDFDSPVLGLATDDDGPGLDAARKDKKSKKGASDGKAAKGKGGPGGPGGKGKEKPFADVIEDFDKHEGLFNLYTKDDKAFIEVAPDQLDKYFMLTLSRTGGVGQTFKLLGNQMVWNSPFKIRKIGKNYQFLFSNVAYRAEDDKNMKVAVSRSFSDSLFASAPAASLPDEKSKNVLIDAKKIFVRDADGIMAFTALALKSPYKLDPGNSFLSRLKAFPNNVEIEASLHFRNPIPKANIATLVDPRSMFVRYNYSVSSIPEDDDFRPRLADDRIGHFISSAGDYSDDRQQAPWTRYVNRWKLEKADPLLPISEPKEPITYYLDHSVPEKYHAALTEGITVWNNAFRKLGFENAVVVKPAPADPDWDSSDVRYATIRWFVSPTASFAIGPSRANPFTGQIYDADIGFAESMMRGARNRYRIQVSPLAMFSTAAEEANYSAIHGWEQQLQELQDSNNILGSSTFMCNIGEQIIQQGAFGMEVLRARGVKPGSPAEDKYVRDFLVAVTAHEVGHTLGLRHNYRASTIHENKDLHNEARTTEMGLTGSVMDYTTVNIAPEGTIQGQYWQTTLGPYDYWAIEYAYKLIEAETTRGELPELMKIASRAADPMLAYSTDEDAMGFMMAPIGMDPRSHQWDLGRDPIGYYTDRMKIAKELWASLPNDVTTDGEGYQVVRRAFSRGLFEYFPAAMSMTKYVGGVMHSRSHVGDPGSTSPYVPVAPAEQRRALSFLNKHFFAADAFSFDPNLVNMLAAERFGTLSGFILLPRLDYPVHDTVLAMQNLALARLYHPALHNRVIDMDTKVNGEGHVGLDEIFGSVRDGIWGEVDGAGKNVNSYRRALQRRHLEYLVRIATREVALAPAEAMTLARYDLSMLKDKIGAAVKNTSLDTNTKAHLSESLGVIEQALTASFTRGV
jgi:hypothetical protein